MLIHTGGRCGIFSRDPTKESILLEDKASLTGDKLVDATDEFSQQAFGEPYVSFILNSE